MGRVVVVMLEDEDETYAVETFHYLAQKLSSAAITIETKQRQLSDGSYRDVVTKIGHLEVAFAKISIEKTKSKFIPNNMPLGSLVGFKEAFQIAEIASERRSDGEIKYLREWLGDEQDPSYWQYVYFTEPDSVLQSRPESLLQLKAEVDRGGILSPHRLQPIPHESDLRGLKDKAPYLNENDGFQEVIVLDPVQEHDVCCDEQPNARPGVKDFPSCHKDVRWWECGSKQKEVEDPHKRLRPYKLIRLAQGVGLTTIAGTQHGRRCIPAKTSYCTP
jgi:hypothetical protein